MSLNRLLEALDSLNQIGETLNHLGSDVSASTEDALRLIVENAVRVVPQTSATICIVEQAGDTFDLTSCVSAGGAFADDAVLDVHLTQIGQQAIQDRKPVLSEKATEQTELTADGQMLSCFPLIVAEQPVGVLYISLHELRSFDPLELSLLSTFTNHAAMVLYHALQVTSFSRDLLRKEDELVHLHRAGLLISSRTRLEDTLEAILQMALEITSARYGIFRLIDKRGDRLYTAAFAGEDLSQPLLEDLMVDSSSITTWVVQNRCPLLIPDLSVSPWSDIYYPLDSAMVMRSELVVPLIGSSGRLEGVLNLESPAVGAFSQADSHLLQSLATQAVVAIQEVRLLDALQGVAEHLLTRPFRDVLDYLVQLAADLLNATDAAVWLRDGDTLLLQASVAERETHDRVPLTDSLIGQAVQQGVPVWSEDVRSDSVFKHLELAKSQRWTHALVVPLLTSDGQEPIGSFSVYGSETNPTRFTDSTWDQKVLVIFAHYVTLAVQNEFHQEELRAAYDQRMLAETFAAFGDISANLLHQINNKVGTIPVRVQGIQAKRATLLQLDSYLATNLAAIEKSARLAMDSMRSSLSLVGPLQTESVNVKICVDDALASIEIPETLHINSDGLADLPSVTAGRQGLMLIFANLIDNAANVMQGQGTITLWGAVNEAGYLDIAVRDDGQGIPLDLQERIFEFNFSHQARPHNAKLGFGLWWVKTLITRLGGQVTVESDNHSGTTFWLRLPLADSKGIIL